MVDQLSLSEQDLAKWVSQSRAIRKLERLPGDASTRRYYRVHAKRGSFILMKTEPFSDEANRYAFLDVQKHLDANGVAVPQIYDVDAAKGFLLLEDLGDATLLRELQGVADARTERKIYQRVLDGLVHLHRHCGPEGTREHSPITAFTQVFDHEKLMWEMDFAIEHFYEAHLARKIKDADKKLMRKRLGEICHHLAALPRVFTHRDFHSRNVMVTKSEKSARYVFIDFQDARMGPAQYDLASLLRDSYYQLEDTQVAHLTEYYLESYRDSFKKRASKNSRAANLDHLNFERFSHDFDLMAVQRNFKAIGSFSSFLNRRGIATYLKYIGNTFENIRRTLLKYPQYSDLREVLFHYYYF